MCLHACPGAEVSLFTLNEKVPKIMCNLCHNHFEKSLYLFVHFVFQLQFFDLNRFLYQERCRKKNKDEFLITYYGSLLLIHLLLVFPYKNRLVRKKLYCRVFLEAKLITVKSSMEISQNFVAFSEYMNFTRHD